jgi:polyhydroxybutyrate depolymerase
MLRAFSVLFGIGLFAFAFATFAPQGQQAQASGCWPGKAHPPGTTIETIVTTMDGTRSYRLHVPPSYNGADRVPIVFSFHGLGSNAIQQELYSGLSTLADSPGGGFIAVYPDGTDNGSGTQFWNVTDQAPPQPQDVTFTSELLDKLESQLCIETNYVFSSGMSNGAEMSVRLACSLSSRIAAVAPVAGAYYPALFEILPDEVCPDTRAVPMIAFHGTADTTVPYNGGPGIFGIVFRLPIDNDTPDEDVMQDWAAHNGCASGRQESQATTNVKLILYDGCTDGATTELYSVSGAGHTWPGSFNGTPEISATALLWDFFQAHPFAVSPQVDTDGDTVPNAIDNDNDNDGCSDEQEASSDSLHGGMRNAKNFWDYADMPILGNSPQRDGKVRIGDILAVVQHYYADDAGGTAAINRNSDPLSTPPATGYHPAFDRGGVIPGGHLWDLAPPDGQIRIDDVLAVVNQYFHDCS